MKRKLLFLILSISFIGALQVKAQTVTIIDLAGLQTEFNSMQGFTRIIFLGDPTCGGCIASANNLRNSIFNYCDHPDLRGMIVWLHVSGFSSTLSNAIAQSALWSDPRVSFYWDSLATGIRSGFGYQSGWSGCNYAWDISMLYSSAATWSGTYPPAPYHCMSKTGCCNPWSITNQLNQVLALGACHNTAGVNENSSSLPGLTISPNPAADELVVWSSEFGDRSMEVYDAIGQRVLQSQISPEASGLKSQISIDVSSLESGIYFVHVRGEKGAAVGKFVKE